MTEKSKQMLFEDRLFAGLKIIENMGQELYFGLRFRTIPINMCLAVGLAFIGSATFGWDRHCFARLGLEKIYPRALVAHSIYVAVLAFAGFFMWTVGQVGLRRKIVRRLTEVFETAGLKTLRGRFPGFVSDLPIDHVTRKLRLTRVGLPIEQFKKATPVLESGMQIFVDQVKEDRERGTIDVIYSHVPMPTLVLWKDCAVTARDAFTIGLSRSEQHQVTLQEVPHVLVAGQTGGGKSTFLRQVITTLYLKNPTYQFTLIDLKEGLEFQLFKGVKRMSVVSSVAGAVVKLEKLERLLTERMDILSKAKCKDIDAFLSLPKEQQDKALLHLGRKDFGRHVVVIDEVAELFLASSFNSAKQCQTSRAVVSRIARLGRAVGLHLFIGTQRPDTRALDTQIKANLTGKVCFAMSDLHSSLVVLGNGRAKELPEVPGRAIWQRGLHMTEVQTPLVSVEEVNGKMAPFIEGDGQSGRGAGDTGGPDKEQKLSHQSPGSSAVTFDV